MARANILVLPGDGIGPEVTTQVSEALRRVAQRFGHDFQFEEALMGGIAIDQTGEPLPVDTLRRGEQADAILMGAVGGPKWSDPNASVRPEQGLLQIRQHFGLFANLRPVKAWPALVQHAPLRPDLLEGVDMLFVRELTGGIYFGERQEPGSGDSAYDTMFYSADEVKRVTDVAFRAAQGRRGKLASIDKANVLASMRLWRRTVMTVAEDYGDVEVEHLLVDAAAMHLLTRPAEFDVIVAGNMFADILSDEASVLAGSLGMLPSASLGTGTFGIYEPIHGSAPDIAGKGIANPIGMILSAALLLRYSLQLETEAQVLEEAVTRALDGGARTADIAPPGTTAMSTEEMAQAIFDQL